MLIVVCIGDASSSTLNDKTASGIIVSFEVCRNLIWQKKKRKDQSVLNTHDSLHFHGQEMKKDLLQRERLRSLLTHNAASLPLHL